MHMDGVRQAARCLYGAGEPSWARCRCYSSSRQPIQYTACVGLLHLFQKVTLKEKNHTMDWHGTGLFLLDQEPTLDGGVAGVHGRPRS